MTRVHPLAPGEAAARDGIEFQELRLSGDAATWLGRRYQDGSAVRPVSSPPGARQDAQRVHTHAFVYRRGSKTWLTAETRRTQRNPERLDWILTLTPTLTPSALSAVRLACGRRASLR